MKGNPVLRGMGFAEGARAAIIHCDDIGMCQASLAAFADLVDFGLVSSGSVMAPSPWFPGAASWCNRHSQVDVGIHMTLTSEWNTYRWRPISCVNSTSGLVDSKGYFHRDRQTMFERADPTAVYAEMQAQIDLAREYGMELTHMDCHMFAALNSRFIGCYLEAAVRNRLPALVVRKERHPWVRGYDESTERYIADLEKQGFPVFDAIAALPLEPHIPMSVEERVLQARRILAGLPPGLTCLHIHPGTDTPELRAIAPDWMCRTADYAAFTSPQLRDYVRNSGIRVIGYRALKNMMPAASGGSEPF